MVKILMKKISNSKQIDSTRSCTAKVTLLATVCSMVIFPHHAQSESELPPATNDTVQVQELSINDTIQQTFNAATGYIHPFLSVEGGYSDNIFNTKDNEKEDFYTTISPGLWVATPRSKEIVLNIDPSNTAPGGLAFEFQPSNIQKKFQAYALYEADIISYSSEGQNDTTNHTAEGMISYALSDDLTFELIDKYIYSFDTFRSDGSLDGVLQTYNSNVLILSADYDFNPKLSVEGVYSNFYLDYERPERAFRDRTDNAGALYLNYQYSPKTSVFLNGEYVRLSFDTATENDADQYNLYAGMQWRPSGKTSLRARLGYVHRSRDAEDAEDASEPAGDLRIQYNITEKTSLTLLGASNIFVSDSNNYGYTRNNFLRLGYRQNITSKILAGLVARVGRRDYQGGDRDDRNDDYFQITPSIQFNLKEWMTARLSYIYETRDSDIEANDYRSNSVLLKFIVSL
ncbi:outer membrane beta-barrel protein [Desulfogranum marinum]|uniref:outer membrane beta-barrel protein n=1 Tax=Desulfogranum marinum TaxID=453220 RepID=UPI0029C92D47|nr:outer membrane beta-barrel protein [Desulfogranum marinum]